MLIPILSTLCYGTMALCGGLALKTIFIDEDIKEAEKEIIETENILKYEYYPVENINLKVEENNVIKYMFTEGEKEGLKVAIGQDLQGDTVSIDMLDGHLLIGGMTGGGKSNILNVLITNLIRTYTPNELLLMGCDFAETDVYYFNQYKHFNKGKVSTNEEQFLSQVEWLERRMTERAEILNKSNCRNIINYNKKHDKKLGYIIFIIDELVQLTTIKKCKDELHRIMSKCRKYGIYFILAAQDATKETIGRCKMNCPQVIGLKTYDETDSTTLLGKGHNLQDITVPGRCKIKNSEGLKETQIFYISEDEIEEVLRPYLKASEN